MGEDNTRVIRLKKRGGFLTVGHGCRTRVMALVGSNSPVDFDRAAELVFALASAECQPDLIADVSQIQHELGLHLWKIAVEETPLVTSTVPLYSVRQSGDRIDDSELLSVATAQMEGGVGVITIHATATHDLLRISRSRIVPCTSRGGSIVLRDLLARGSSCENVYLRILRKLVSVAKRTGTVVSLGATFRSANIFDSLDQTQVAEIKQQLELAQDISQEGVSVVIEGPGHIPPYLVPAFAELVDSAPFPIMPLGPIPTDAAENLDHVAAAIGAVLLGIHGRADILAAVTRAEHCGGIPTSAETIEAVRTTRLAAHIIDMIRLGDVAVDRLYAESRARASSCLAGSRVPGCSRCGEKCPLAAISREDLPERTTPACR